MEQFEKFYIKAAHFLKVRPRSEKELRDNLLKKKAPPEIIERIIITLRKQNFLDDTAFAKWWVDQRIRFRPKAKRVIRLELLQKGVDKEIIDTLFSSDEEGMPEVNELEQAKRLVEQRLRRYRGFTQQEVYQKLGGFLARRGYGWDIIKRSIDEVMELEYNS